MYDPEPKFQPRVQPRVQPKVAVPSYLKESGQVGNWLFYSGAGNRLFDFSGRGNHGKIHGAKWTDEGLASWALSLDGEDDYVDSLARVDATRGTVILMLSTAVAAGATRCGFYQANDSAGDNDFSMINWNDDNSYWGWVIAGTDYRYSTTDAFPSGWWMATVRWNGDTGDRDVYWNKTLKDSITDQPDPSGNLPYSPMLGCLNDAGTANYHAPMDVLRLMFYDDFLSESRIFDIYEKTKPLYAG